MGMVMRSYNRFKTDQTVGCTVGKKQGKVSLYNLSSGGCMIETKSKYAQEGARIVIDLTDTLSMSGKIVWRVDQSAGIKFDIPLHPKIVEKFGYSEDEEFDRNDPRDRFGIPLVDYAHAGAGMIE